MCAEIDLTHNLEAQDCCRGAPDLEFSDLDQISGSWDVGYGGWPDLTRSVTE